MATGRGTAERGGVLAPADVRGAGTISWEEVAGVPAGHPLVSETDGMNFNIAGSHNRIVTTPEGQMGPASGGLVATPETAGMRHVDDWRDVFNFKGSPIPWLLLISIGVLAFAHASVQARAGAFGRTASARAALE